LLVNSEGRRIWRRGRIGLGASCRLAGRLLPSTTCPLSALVPAGRLRLVAERYRLPALYDPGEAYGPPAAWWEVGWNDELVSFTARLLAEPADDGDLVEVEPVTVIGQRMGELVDVPELVERMEAEDPHLQLAADLVARLEVDRDRYLEALTPQASRELVERLAAS
jgi:hypothetical protein